MVQFTETFRAEGVSVGSSFSIDWFRNYASDQVQAMYVSVNTFSLVSSCFLYCSYLDGCQYSSMSIKDTMSKCSTEGYNSNWQYDTKNYGYNWDIDAEQQDEFSYIAADQMQFASANGQVQILFLHFLLHP